MKRLEDIPKKNIYQVPEGYFDRLPGVIQSRVTESKRSYQFTWGVAVRYALPVFIGLAAGIFWYQSNRSVEDKLEKIDVEQLAYFLEDSDFTTEELTETVTWSEDDMMELEESVYSTLEIPTDDLGDWIEELDDKM